MDDLTPDEQYVLALQFIANNTSILNRCKLPDCKECKYNIRVNAGEEPTCSLVYLYIISNQLIKVI